MPELILLELADDANGSKAGVIANPSKHIDVYILDGANPTTVAIPSGAKKAMFATDGNKDIWVNFNGTAEIPVADVTDGSGSELNPSTRKIDGYTSFSMIAAQETYVSVSYYA